MRTVLSVSGRRGLKCNVTGCGRVQLSAEFIDITKSHIDLINLYITQLNHTDGLIPSGVASLECCVSLEAPAKALWRIVLNKSHISRG
jgi:hypothetical protein